MRCPSCDHDSRPTVASAGNLGPRSPHPARRVWRREPPDDAVPGSSVDMIERQRARDRFPVTLASSSTENRKVSWPVLGSVLPWRFIACPETMATE